MSAQAQSLWTRARQRTAWLLACPLLGLVACAQVSAWLWVGELCTHWTLHAACALIVVSLIAKRGSVLQIICILAATLALVPWVMSAYQPRLPPPGTVAKRAIAIGCANVYDFNRSRPRMREMLHDASQAILGLEEVKTGDQDALRSDQRWPYQEWTSGPDQLNVALLSEYPIRNAQIHQIAHAVVLEAIIDIHGRILRVLVTHLSSPHHGPAYLEHQNLQLATITTLVHSGIQPVVVMGDFNLTPGSPRWRSFLAESGLGRPPGHEPATWPALLGPCGIPIDHLLVHEAELGSETAFPVPGSDHRGVAGVLYLDTDA